MRPEVAPGTKAASVRTNGRSESRVAMITLSIRYRSRPVVKSSNGEIYGAGCVFPMPSTRSR